MTYHRESRRDFAVTSSREFARSHGGSHATKKKKQKKNRREDVCCSDAPVGALFFLRGALSCEMTFYLGVWR